MIRVIVDSQNNRLFRGIPSEQAYDQRGGLCEVGGEGIVVTANPYDPEYLVYWSETLGFDLPRLISVGPYDPRYTLSDLILRKEKHQKLIRQMLNGGPARLEFFCIEESERRLTSSLGIPAYCNFDMAISLSKKPAFKNFFEKVGVPTPVWFSCVTKEDLLSQGEVFLKERGSFLVKAGDGTGGLACGGMFRIKDSKGLLGLVQQDICLGQEFLIEKIIPSAQTVSVHWEITDNKSLRFIGLFDQRGQYTYSGVSWPARISSEIANRILSDVSEKLGPALLEDGGLGFFCGDIVIGEDGCHLWVDFNPRKGAILYIYNLTRRLSACLFGGARCYFVHEHLRLTGKGDYSFLLIKEKLRDLLSPSEQSFVVVTNPGVIPFGYADIAGVSPHSPEEAGEIFNRAKERLLR